MLERETPARDGQRRRRRTCDQVTPAEKPTYRGPSGRKWYRLSMVTLLRFIACVLAAALTVSVTPTNAAEPAARARAQFRRGMTALKAGDTARASQAFAKSTEAAPRWALAYLQWGVAQQLYDPESKDVFSALKMAVALAPENARAHFHLARAYLRAEDYDSAITHLQQTLRSRPNYPRARFLLGRAYAEQGDSQNSITTLHDVLREEPKHTGAITLLAELYEKDQRLEDTEAMLRRLTILFPEVTHHHLRLARFYEQIGEAERAEAARQRAEVVDPRPKRKMRPLLGRRRKRRRR